MGILFPIPFINLNISLAQSADIYYNVNVTHRIVEINSEEGKEIIKSVGLIIPN